MPFVRRTTRSGCARGGRSRARVRTQATLAGGADRTRGAGAVRGERDALGRTSAERSGSKCGEAQRGAGRMSGTRWLCWMWRYPAKRRWDWNTST